MSVVNLPIKPMVEDDCVLDLIVCLYGSQYGFNQQKRGIVGERGEGGINGAIQGP